jgi:hypothetical protein
MKVKFANTKEIIDNKVHHSHEGDIHPKKIKNCLIAMILRENKGAYFKKIKSNREDFRHRGHFYFINPKAIYLCGRQRFSIYMEGISTPMSHSNIEYEIKDVTITNPVTNDTEIRKLTKIKGLKYDSKTLDVLVNTKLAQIFLRVKEGLGSLLVLILLIVSVALSAICVYVSYTYR